MYITCDVVAHAQGEVEQIAMMKPRAQTEHEDGMLEFLEDIIGSSRFVSPISELAQRVDSLNEMRGEKVRIPTTFYSPHLKHRKVLCLRQVFHFLFCLVEPSEGGREGKERFGRRSKRGNRISDVTKRNRAQTKLAVSEANVRKTYMYKQ